ncbi:cilia- and flagella-associated protein 43 [Caerostris extrusa]|uniref:Cilia- and flagella-associated protein 43 n=1 Tax=Caerostris extrusa TaxID=172846 RepID=A0AAV4XFY8_CAEEX|nr:cilia- and flagella-associated protein 43 [Caerostris extrusa]
MNSLCFLPGENGTFKVISKTTSDETKGQCKPLSIMCHCWIPKHYLLIETSSGLLKVNPYLCNATAFNREPESKYAINSMVFSKMGLFVGYKTGFIDIVNISRDHWSIIETFKVSHPIKNLLMSPLL